MSEGAAVESGRKFHAYGMRFINEKKKRSKKKSPAAYFTQVYNKTGGKMFISSITRFMSVVHSPG